MGKRISVLYDMDACLVCGSIYVERHHIFYGNNRKKADRLKYIAPLCAEHHRGNSGVHGGNNKLDEALKQTAQLHFEQTGTRKEFIDIFGKSYI